MKTEIKQKLKDSVANFHLPRYAELPTVGLYLEQVAKYINSYLVSVGCPEITTSMISNYVKKDFIPPPQKKQYYPDQIAYLIFITVIKNVLPLENIVEMFEMQKENYTLPMAYDYFCSELENMVFFVFGIKTEPEKNIGVTNSDEKDLLRNVIISVSHSMYITATFAKLKSSRLTDE